MSTDPIHALLPRRALVSVAGPDWRNFLQGLLTQDVATLAPGEARFSALLTPQGKVIYDLILVGREDGVWLEVLGATRDPLIQRLNLYRLRAQVEVTADETPVSNLFRPVRDGESHDSHGPRPPQRAGEVWVADPRLPEFGWRGYGAAPVEGARPGDQGDYKVQRVSLGVPGPEDWGVEATYALEANFDLLNGIDFRKGCFVGQEITSRMKRRGQVKSRMLPITFEGPAPAPGSEVLAGDLRAGQVLSGGDGKAMALLRLDRALGARLTVEGRPVTAAPPAWFAKAVGEPS